jgi:ABC-2 type transport system permease protein
VGGGGGVVADAAALGIGRSPGVLEQIGVVARRSAVKTLRQRALLVFPVLFPLILFAINGSALSSASKIHGFPAPSYRAFALGLPFMQGALFVAITAGTDMAKDIETGFFNRLALTPLKGSSLLVGMLGGAVVVACIQSVIYLAVGIATGVGIKTGVPGAIVLLILSVVIAFGFACVGALMALRFGTGEAVQALFPLLFVFLFLSSANFPRNLIEVGWFKEIATLNPVSYMIEGIRSLIFVGWDAKALALAFGFAGLLIAISLALAGRALRTRLVRT